MTPEEAIRLEIYDILEHGEQFRRAFLFDTLYESLPRDPSARVQMYHYSIAPGGYTNWHLHNGATFFLVLQGEFEAHFEDGTRFSAKLGDVYTEPIGKVHRGHNPGSEVPNIGIGINLTSPDREPVTNVTAPVIGS
jgi:quercetin dioxygenase-like cupin family protein